MIRPRMIFTSDREAVRLRVLSGAAAQPVLELTQLHRCPGGYEAEAARVSLPLDQFEPFVSALRAINAEAQQEGAGEGSKRRLRWSHNSALRARARGPKEGYEF